MDSKAGSTPFTPPTIVFFLFFFSFFFLKKILQFGSGAKVDKTAWSCSQEWCQPCMIILLLVLSFYYYCYLLLLFTCLDFSPALH